MSLILAIDQGTTSSRAIAFEVSPQAAPGAAGEQARRERDLRPASISQIELAQHFPRSGWVEHDAAEIWTATLQTCREVVRQAGGISRFGAIGITNQRETAVIWDAATGEPLHRAIVWQDRRTADVTARLVAQGHEPQVQQATGLILDPYFSATKFAWLLDAVPGSRARAEAGEVKLGTIDAWLIWKLTGGRVHATDATNAARTSLMDLKTLEWREDLCALFDVPIQIIQLLSKLKMTKQEVRDEHKETEGSPEAKGHQRSVQRAMAKGGVLGMIRSLGLELAKDLNAEVDIVTVSEPWAVGMYDAMGWSVGYMNSPEYKADREEGAQKVLQPALAKGAPIEYVFPPEGIIGVHESWGIVKESPHPEAAKLFLDWFIGLPGQNAYGTDLMYNSLRADVTPPVGGVGPEKMKLLFPDDWDAFIKTHPQFVREWDKITGVR